MAPHHASLPPVAKPNHSIRFDAWNSSSSGHQIAGDRMTGSIGWMKSRSIRLTHQYNSRGTRGRRSLNCTEPQIMDRDDESKSFIDKGVDAQAKTSVIDMLLLRRPIPPKSETRDLESLNESGPTLTGVEATKYPASERLIFAGCIIYINGSTQPIISDHRLKQVLAENGARLSICLGRRQVTHVILGKPCSTRFNRDGAGGGMAASKTEREIKKVGGCGIKYVGVEWVLESLERGIRQPEAKFATTKVAPKGQRSVYNLSVSGNRHL